MKSPKKKFSCIILAGGEGKRVGGRDKGLIDYHGKPLIQHVIDNIKPQVDEIIISANRNIEKYETCGYKVVSDNSEKYLGPMAGIAATLPYCQNDWVFITPCDMPFLPLDIISSLYENKNGSSLSIAKVSDRLQLALLMNKNLLPSILQALSASELRLMQWAKSQKPTFVFFTNEQNFSNLNSSTDLKRSS